MLSVLWRKHDGAEVLFAAERIERTCHSEPQVPASGKFVASGVAMNDAPGDTMTFDIEGPFGAVFVMNETGKTIARYFADAPR